jgi:RimJ/RimL family protein N-acetyltransferase
MSVHGGEEWAQVTADDLEISGYGYRLRTVQPEDASFIVALRTGSPDRMRYLHPLPPDISRQEEWIRRQSERPGDYYWVVERLRDGARDGTIGLYNLDPVGGSAEWGRWALREGSLAATESVLLVHRVAFARLALRSVYSLTVAENATVVSFHTSCGLLAEATLPRHFEIAGVRYDAVRHSCTLQMWPDVEARLARQAEFIAQRWG